MKIPIFHCVQLELTEGCNRYCHFCGIRSIRKGPNDDLKFATIEMCSETSKSLARADWSGRIELAMHGEPLLNPMAFECIAAIRKNLKNAQIQITTNGKVMIGQMKKWITSLFSAGVNFIVMDTYRPEREQLRNEVKTTGARIIDLYSIGNTVTPYTHHHGKLDGSVILLDDLALVSGVIRSRTICNHAGNNKCAPIPPVPLRKQCTIPYRELAVSYSGDVLFCCRDFKRILCGGNVMERDAVEIWNSDKFHHYRSRLQFKDRNFAPCSVCDSGCGARVGLLYKYKQVIGLGK